MIAQLAKLLGLTTEHAEASMFSERAARHVLSRRTAIGLGAAMAAGSVFSLGEALQTEFPVHDGLLPTWDGIKVSIGNFCLPGVVTFTYSLDGGRTVSRPRPFPRHGIVDIPETGMIMKFPQPFRGVL